MSVLLGYIGAFILLIMGGIATAIHYRMFAFQGPQEPPEPSPEPQNEPVEALPEPVAPEPMPEETNTDKLYTLAKSLLGQRLGRDKSIPWMVGCANACTDVLIRAGVKGLPAKGIGGTASLLSFLEDSPEFKEIEEYTPGAVIINATGTGNGRIRGHVGIAGKKQIMSNNSENGTWDTQWDAVRWHNYYEVYGGIPTRFFIMK